VAGAKLAGCGDVVGQRQHNAGCHQPVTTDQGCAIVQRGVGKENIDQQLASQHGVQRHARFGVVLQAGFAFEDDEGAISLTGKLTGSTHDFIDGLFGDNIGAR
jgi:hypothetical protein